MPGFKKGNPEVPAGLPDLLFHVLMPMLIIFALGEGSRIILSRKNR
jgi:hypothetical protein